MKKLLYVLSGLVIAVIGTYYLLFLQIGTPDRKAYQFDLDAIRSLAVSTGEPLPVAINAEAPVTLTFPSAAVIPGWGFASRPLPVYAYQVRYAHGHVMIDTSMNAAQANRMGGEGIAYDEAAQARILASIEHADKIVFTHEHYDHIGNAIAHPKLKDLLDVIRLTDRQMVDRSYWGGERFVMDVEGEYKPLKYDGLHLLRPGVVLIDATGHTPGTQMIYVQRQDGQEYVFVGDITWTYAGIVLVRPKPNLTSRYFLREDRPKTHAQLAFLNDLVMAHQNIEIIVGHDKARNERQMEEGLLGRQFQ